MSPLKCQTHGQVIIKGHEENSELEKYDNSLSDEIFGLEFKTQHNFFARCKLKHKLLKIYLP
jgi:hypothetical protein